MNGDTVLITGVTGFIGQNLLAHLCSVWPRRRLIGTARHSTHSAIPILPCDFRRWLQVRSLYKQIRPDIIFHCVGTTAAGPWSYLYDAHVTCTANLLGVVSESAPPWPRIILIGSAAEYGDVASSRQPIVEAEPVHPLTPYAISKRCQTAIGEVFAAKGLPVIIARLFNLIAQGSPSSFSYNHFAAQLFKKKSRSMRAIKTGSLKSIRDFISQKDLARALTALALRGRAGEIYNVASGRAVRMRDLLREMMNMAGLSVPIRESLSRASLRNSVLACVGDPRKIQRHTGWAAHDDWRRALHQFVKGTQAIDNQTVSV